MSFAYRNVIKHTVVGENYGARSLRVILRSHPNEAISTKFPSLGCRRRGGATLKSRKNTRKTPKKFVKKRGTIPPKKQKNKSEKDIKNTLKKPCLKGKKINKKRGTIPPKK
jgi:hypothetical protein